MHILFWIYRSRSNQINESPIKMRITLDGKRSDFKTKISVDPNQWDRNKQRIKGNSPLVKEYNNTLMALTTAAWNHYNDTIRKGKTISPDTIRDLILNKNKSHFSLLSAFAYQIDNLTKRVGYDISENTVKKYRTVETKLKLFLRKKMNRDDISLSELNHKFIIDLDMYMKLEEGLKHNAVIKCKNRQSRPLMAILN